MAARRVRLLLIRVAGEHDQAVGDDAALDGLVLVVVSADEARHHDHAVTVDVLPAGSAPAFGPIATIFLPSTTTSAFS